MKLDYADLYTTLLGKTSCVFNSGYPTFSDLRSQLLPKHFMYAENPDGGTFQKRCRHVCWANIRLKV